MVGHGRGSDERSAGVDALAAHEPLDGHGCVDNAVGVRVLVVGLLEVRRVLVGLLLVLVEGVGKLELGIVREHLRELLALVDREAQNAVGVVYGLLGLDGGVRDDLAHVVLAVDVAHVLQDVLEVLVVEVHVDIGHLGALRREEPLKHEAVLERVEVRDVHGVRDDGAGGRSAAWSHANAVVLGPLHVVLHDEEVVREALLGDDLVLVLEAVLDVPATDGEVAPVLAVALGKALLALLTKALVSRLPRAQARVLGQVHVGPVELVVALVGNLERGVAGLGAPGEELAHLVLGLHVELRALHAHAVGVIEGGCLAYAGKDVLRRGILAREVVEVVGGNNLHAHLVRHLDQVLVELAVIPSIAEGEAVILDLDVEVVTKDVTEGLCPPACSVKVTVQDALGNDALNAGTLADEALVVLLEHVERGARPVVHHLVAGGLGHALHQVVVARLVLGKKDEVVAALLCASFDAVIGDEVGLAAKDGLHLEARAVCLDRSKVVARGLPHGHVACPLVVDAIEIARVVCVWLGLLEVPALLEALDVVAPLLHVGLAVVVLAAFQVEVGDAKHVAVVRKGNGRHPLVNGALDHAGNGRGAIEDREVRVIV